MDELFEFSQTLAYDYKGEWLPGLVDGDSVFRITIQQQSCPGCTPMPNIATVRPKDTAAIRTRSGSSPRAFAPSPPLEGEYGKTRGLRAGLALCISLVPWRPSNPSLGVKADRRLAQMTLDDRR